MWCSRRTFLKLSAGAGLLAALVACGMTPVNAPGSAARSVIGRIAIDEVPGRIGHDLVAALEERLGRPDAGDARWRLSVTLDLSTEQGGFTTSGTATRYQLVADAHYEVRSEDGGAVVTTGRARDFVGYDAAGTILSTRTAERDAQGRLAVMLADRIAARLAATAGDWAE